MSKKKQQEEQELKYTKEQILNSGEFSNRIDALEFLIEDDEILSINEVNSRLNIFYNREV